jgi:hypothetical protein
LERTDLHFADSFLSGSGGIHIACGDAIARFDATLVVATGFPVLVVDWHLLVQDWWFSWFTRVLPKRARIL